VALRSDRYAGPLAGKIPAIIKFKLPGTELRLRSKETADPCREERRAEWAVHTRRCVDQQKARMRGYQQAQRISLLQTCAWALNRLPRCTG
jgi:hypothetical protein